MGPRSHVPRLAALAALAGCADAAPLRLELEPDPAHRAVIVSVAPAEAGPLLAWDPRSAPPEPLLLDLPGAGGPRVTALYYEASLEALGLRPGPLVRAEDGLPLPEPDRLAQADVDGAGPPAWRPLERMPDDLRALRVQAELPCAAFEPAVVELPFTGVGGLAAAPDGAAWVLATDGRLWRVRADGDATPLATGLPVGGLAAPSPDTLWLGGAGGRLVRLEVRGETATVTARMDLPEQPWIEALGLPPGGAAPAFALSRSRRLFGEGPGGWRRLAAVDADIGDVGGLAAIGPREALFGFDDGLVAYRWTEDELREESVPANAFDSGLTALAHWPDYGTVIGTAVGELLVRPRERDAWVRLEGAYSTLDVEALARYEDGFVYSDERGVVVQYQPGFGFCPPTTPPAGSIGEGRRLVVSGSDLITAGDAPDGGQPAQVFWYRRRAD